MPKLESPKGSHRLDRELEVARALALRAGELVLRHRHDGLARSHKPGGEIVTSADIEADGMIRAGLAEAFPGDGILSEESADSARRLSCARVWIVDPIDGTRDYAAGGDEHAISIGLAVGGHAVLGVVHNPARGELFAGTIADGLTLGAAPARVTMTRDLASARLTMSRTEWESGLERLASALPVRPLSSAAYKLARVAAGLDDGTFSIWPRKEWDACAGVALVRAGAGEVTLLDGSEVVFNREDVRLPGGLIAAGPALHRAVLAELVRLGLATPLAPHV